MDFLELAKRRHSVRSFSPEKVEADKVGKILEAARVAPTAANLQPVKLIVAQDESALEKIGEAADVYGAPLAIVVCADHSRAWQRPLDGKATTDIDASIVCDHMMMEATDLGLGSVWICWFDAQIVRSKFGLPEEIEPVNILAIGYSAEPPADPERHATQRIPLDDLLLSA